MNRAWKCMVLFATLALASTVLAAEPTITLETKLRYPWNGLVDLNFTITGTSGTKYDTSFTAKDLVGGTNVVMRTIRKSNGVAANATKEQLLPGNYKWVWDAAADLPEDWNCDRMAVTGSANLFTYSVKFNANGGSGTMANESFTYGTAKALTANAFTRTGYTFQGWATSASGSKVYNDKQSVSNLTETSGAVVNLYAVWEWNIGTYLVVDLASGSVSSLSAVPSGGWTDTYKTTKLVLRKLNKGTYKMQGKSNVTLTKQFYIGVFEVTQKQWSLLMSSNPAKNYGVTDRSPVYYVSYNMIRGSSNGAKWPSSSSVDSSSFIGKLRSRTSLGFDLPTEAQWEYACRAGTTTKYYWGTTMNGGYAWHWGNSSNTVQPVGSLKANAWGLYDMSGNVKEWTLDWFGTLTYGTDPTGPSSGSKRAARGGCFLNVVEDSSVLYCSSLDRYDYPPSWVGNPHIGFRLALTLSN